jgi:hypothetical protein
MKITFNCPGCGRAHTVDSANAGRKGRCNHCGGMMTVPEEEQEAYSLVESEPAPSRPARSVEVPIESQATFAARPETLVNRPKKNLKKKLIRQAKEEVSDFVAIASATWKWWVGVPVGVAVVLGSIAALLPNGALIAACILAVVGIVMILTGFVIGAYGAFHEDFLNGMLYVFIPFYTAYFIATNWDAMWRWAILMFVGSILILFAGKIALPRLEEMDKTDTQQSRVVIPELLLRMELAARTIEPNSPNLAYSGS